MKPGVLVLALTACWHSSRGPEPARWHDSAKTAAELLPAGAWLVVALDVDSSQSASQRAAEAKARAGEIKTSEGGCQVPMNHAAFAVYGHARYGFIGRGVFAGDAMLACLASSYVGKDRIEHSTIAGHEVLVTTGAEPFGFLVSDSGLFAAGTPSIIERILATPFRPVTVEPSLATLIDRARRGGEIWAAARFPRDEPYVGDVLDLLAVKLTGRVVTLVAFIHFTPPFELSIELELEQSGDASTLAAVLARRKRELVGLDPHLASVVDAVAIAVDGTRVRLTGHFAKIDWLQTLQALLAAVSRFKS